MESRSIFRGTPTGVARARRRDLEAVGGRALGDGAEGSAHRADCVVGVPDFAVVDLAALGGRAEQSGVLADGCGDGGLGEGAEPEHRRQRVHRPGRIPPLPDAARQRLGQAEPAFRPRAAGQARRPTRSTRRRNRRSPSCVVRLEDRTGGEYLRSWRAWRSRLLRRKCAGQRIFYPMSTTYATFAHYILASCRIEWVNDRRRFFWLGEKAGRRRRRNPIATMLPLVRLPRWTALENWPTVQRRPEDG